MVDVEAVVLAAGMSSRCPAYKMTLPLCDHTLIEYTIAALAPWVDRVWVVTGWRGETVRTALASHAQVCCIHNDEYSTGMFSSVRVGLAATRASRVFVQPGDIPLVSGAVYSALLESDRPVAIPVYRGHKGHPVLLRREVVEAVLRAPADSNLREALSPWGYDAVTVDDEGILLDVDTMADYQRLVDRSRHAVGSPPNLHPDNDPLGTKRL